MRFIDLLDLIDCQKWQTTMLCVNYAAITPGKAREIRCQCRESRRVPLQIFTKKYSACCKLKTKGQRSFQKSLHQRRKDSLVWWVPFARATLAKVWIKPFNYHWPLLGRRPGLVFVYCYSCLAQIPGADGRPASGR